MNPSDPSMYELQQRQVSALERIADALEGKREVSQHLTVVADRYSGGYRFVCNCGYRPDDVFASRSDAEKMAKLHMRGTK